MISEMVFTLLTSSFLVLHFLLRFIILFFNSHLLFWTILFFLSTTNFYQRTELQGRYHIPCDTNAQGCAILNHVLRQLSHKSPATVQLIISEEKKDKTWPSASNLSNLCPAQILIFTRSIISTTSTGSFSLHLK